MSSANSNTNETPNMGNRTNTEPGPDVREVRGSMEQQETSHEKITPNDPDLSRRRFLNKITLALGGVGGLAIGGSAIAFMVGPLLQKVPETWRTVGAVEQFKIGETVQIAFADASPLPWAGVTAQTSAWLRRTTANSFVAFAVNCTHLGCPVSWLPGAQLFLCPCHGGTYDLDGKPVAGPPQHSLARYDIRINKGQVEVKATGTPLPTE